MSEVAVVIQPEMTKFVELLAPSPANLDHIMIRWMLAVVVVCHLPVVPAFAGQPDSEGIWDQWRGPSRDGMVADAKWPEDISDLKQAWSIKLGPSYSGPIVTADRVFVTETRDQKTEVVTALDRKTGKEIWSTDWPGAMSVPFFAASNGSWIRSTPAYDGERLYIAGMRDLLVALDAKTGEVAWKVDFMKKYETALPAFGFVASPLVVGDHVYVQAGASFAKLEAATGKVVWRSLVDGGGTYGSAFSSPTTATILGKEMLLVQTRKELCGVDFETGDVLFSHPVEAFRGMNILTPTAIENRIFTSSYGGGSVMFTVTKNDSGEWKIEKTWKNKVQGYMSSPVVIDGHIYLHLRNQRVACINVETGDEAWISKPYGKYWSLVASGDQILALDEKGILYRLRANPEEFTMLSEKKVSESGAWAHLAVLGDEIFIRGLTEMTVLKIK